MKLKDAILKSLDDLKGLCTCLQVYEHIVKNNYYNFFSNCTQLESVSVYLNTLTKNGDILVKRTKFGKKRNLYYLAKYENIIDFNALKKSYF